MGEVARFAHAVGRLFIARDPDHLTEEFSKADRGTRIYVDTGRNGYSATFAAAYAVRRKARRTGFSSVHVGRDRTRARPRPTTFTLRTMADRVAKVGDLWADMRRRKRSLRQPIERLERLLASEAKR